MFGNSDQHLQEIQTVLSTYQKTYLLEPVVLLSKAVVWKNHQWDSTDSADKKKKKLLQ